jgi:hypothetical protein
VTEGSPRRQLSWFNRIPLQATIPWTSRWFIVIQ